MNIAKMKVDIINNLFFGLKYSMPLGANNGWSESGSANLVTIWNDMEDQFFYSMIYEGFKYAMNDLSKSIWIGLKIIDNTPNGKINWIDNYTLSWSNWGPHEPNIRPGVNCGYIDNFMRFPKDWSWKLDNNCARPRSFICKLDKFGHFQEPVDKPQIDVNLGSPLDCDNGWHTHENSWHCFLPVGKKVSHPEAKRLCRNENANLVSIFGESSNNYAKRYQL